MSHWLGDRMIFKGKPWTACTHQHGIFILMQTYKRLSTSELLCMGTSFEAVFSRKGVFHSPHLLRKDAQRCVFLDTNLHPPTSWHDEAWWSKENTSLYHLRLILRLIGTQGRQGVKDAKVWTKCITAGKRAKYPAMARSCVRDFNA